MIVVEMRVFPFSFPPIRGGAQGGVSPTPTPEPTPDPYDLSSASVVLTARNNFPDWTSNAANFKIVVSGIVVMDNSGVSSVKLDLSTLDWTANGTSVTVPSQTFGLSKNDPSESGTLYSVTTSDSSAEGKTVGVSGDVTFRAYDADGNVVQEDTITVVGY